jgi:hypothetical protein
MAADYLVKGKLKSTEFIGAVQHLTTNKDTVFTNVDPFHDQKIDQERVYKGGQIKKRKESKTAHIAIPNFFISRSFKKQAGKSLRELNSLTLLKINVTEVKDIKQGDGVIVSFKNPNMYERPYVVKLLPYDSVLQDYLVERPRKLSTKKNNEGSTSPCPTKKKEGSTFVDWLDEKGKQLDAAFSGSFGALAASGSAWVDDLDDLFSISETFEKLDDPNSDWFAADKDVNTFFKDMVDSVNEKIKESARRSKVKEYQRMTKEPEPIAWAPGEKIDVFAVNEEDTTEKK